MSPKIRERNEAETLLGSDAHKNSVILASLSTPLKCDGYGQGHSVANCPDKKPWEFTPEFLITLRLMNLVRAFSPSLRFVLKQRATPSVPKCMSLGNMFQPGENGQMDIYAPSSNFESVSLLPQRLPPLPPPRRSTSASAAPPPALHLHLHPRPPPPSPPPRSSSPRPGAPPGPRAPRWCSATARWWRRAAALLPAAGGGELVLCCRPLVEASCCLRAPRGCSSPCTGVAAAEVLAAGQELL